jgi:hypothetical protein
VRRVGAFAVLACASCRDATVAASSDAGLPERPPVSSREISTTSSPPVSLDAGADATAKAASYRLIVHGTKTCPGRPFERLGPERRRFGVDLEIAAAAPLIVDPHFATLRDGAGRAYRATFGGCEPDLRYTRLSAGGRVRGWVSFEVPAGAGGFELSYNPHVSDAGRIEPVTTKL